MFNPLPQLNLPDSRPSFYVIPTEENLKFYFLPDEYGIHVTDYTSEVSERRSPPPNNLMSLYDDLKNGLIITVLNISAVVFMIFAAPIGCGIGYWDGERAINLVKGYTFAVVRDLQGCVGTVVAFVARDTGLNIYNNALIQKTCYEYCLRSTPASSILFLH